MDCPIWMSPEFGRRLFFFITIALPWRDDFRNAILDTLFASSFCCFVDGTGRPVVSIIPWPRAFGRGFPGQMPPSGCRTAADSETATLGQFNDGVERRHVLPSSGTSAGSALLDTTLGGREPGYAE